MKRPAPESRFVDPFDSTCPAIANFACEATRIEDKLKCIPGLTATEMADAGVDGLRRFNMVLTQPVDHDQPDGATFQQRLVLWHRDETAPMVLFTSGYQLSSRVSEPAQLLAANQLTYEHRFFGPSIPANDPTFRTLTVSQAARDAHRLVEVFRPLYRSRWLNTGRSKGGMTSVFHRKFFPCDVDATVAYVPPNLDGTSDQAYSLFLKSVGGDGAAACRADVTKAQRAALARRDELIAKMPKDLTYNVLGQEQAFEFAVIDTFFGFWQYTLPTDPDHGCSRIPKPDASAHDLAKFVDRHGAFFNSSDNALEDFKGYWVANAKELGFVAPYNEPLADLLKFGASYVSAAYARGTYDYDPKTQTEVTDWVSRDAKRMLFIYGGLDPWSARLYPGNDAHASYQLIVPDHNHQVGIANMTGSQQRLAVDALERWIGVKR